MLFTVPRTHPNVDAVLDAARRSAGLENSRLSRILDVGTDDDLAYVVEEALEGSHSLAALLSAGALPAPEVRRIAGETALVLDLARHRGLHHQRLTPDLVMRTPDGDVKVRGLATMAALAGIDDVDDQTAARADAIAVVAIAYAGFTGHWPLPGDGGGLPPAPRVSSHVAAPSEIAVGVPADLDALCRLTFANDQGPITPGDFARQIAPWSPIPVLLPTLDAPEPSSMSTDTGSDQGAADRAEVVHEPEPEDESEDAAAPEAAAPDVSADVGEPDEAPSPSDTPRESGVGAAAGAAALAGGAALAGAAAGARAPGPGMRSTDPAPRTPGGGPGSSADGPKGSSAGGPEGRTAADARKGVPVARRVPAAAAGKGPAPRPGAPAPKAPVRPEGPSPVAAMTAATTAALGSAGAATASAARALSGRISDWSSATRDRAREAVDDVRARREQSSAARGDGGPGAGRPTGAVGASGSPALARPATTPVGTRSQDELEPPIPLLPQSAAEPLTRDESRMAIGIIVGFLVLALVLAMWGLSRIPSLPTFGGSDEAGPAPTATPTGGATDGSTDGATEGGEEGNGEDGGDAPPAGPLAITTAIDYDPLGDGEERPEQLERILDGDDSTWWGSEGYRNSEFSGLKAGLGVILDLGESAAVREVTLELPSETTGTIHITDDGGFADGNELGDLAAAGSFSGEGPVTVTLEQPVTGRYVIVWFTEISRGDEEWYRARLAGATVTG
jgi:hypothetical protein